MPISGIAFWTDLRPLIYVFFGWALHELSDLVKLRREDRRAIGKALSELLGLRHDINVVPLAMKLVEAHLPVPPESKSKLRPFLGSLTAPTMKGIHERYNAAVDCVAGRLPLLAFQLRSKDAAGPILQQLHTLAAGDPQAAIVLSKFEEKLVEELQPSFDDLALTLARSHGWWTWWCTKGVLKPSPGSPQEVQRLMSWLVEIVNETNGIPPASDGS